MELYWLLRIPKIHDFFITISVLSFFSVLILSIILFVILLEQDDDYCDNHDKEEVNRKINLTKLIKWSFILFIISCIFSCFIPTASDLAIMMGWDAINSNSVAEVVEILKTKLVNM